MTDPWKDSSLSPNGRPVQENFSTWFGKSGVVDASGEPLRVYHGSTSEFDAFSYDKIGDNGRSEGAGFYFTTDRSIAAGYGQVREFYLSLQKPMPYEHKAFSPALMCKLIKRVAQLEAEHAGIDLADGFLSNFFDIRSDGLELAAREATRIFCRETDALSQLGGLVGSGVSPRHVNAATREVTGFDGIVSKGFSNAGGEDKMLYVAFFPEQIKSATNNSGLYSLHDANCSDRPSSLNLISAIRAAKAVEGAINRGKHRRSEP